MEQDPQYIQQLMRSVESARNLIPDSCAVATDTQADTKARWSAFDKVYAAVEEFLETNGSPIQPTPFDPKGLTEEQVSIIAERSKRYQVAVALLTGAYGSSQEAISIVVWEAEVLVPAQPDPETMQPVLTMHDQAILFETGKVLASDLPEDWECFFKKDTVSLARRKLAFLRLYTCMAGTWIEHSLFAKKLTPIQRQSFITLTLMSFVPQDQWTSQELEQLNAELLPVEEPDWEALAAEI